MISRDRLERGALSKARKIAGCVGMGSLLLAALRCSDSDPTVPACQSTGSGTLAFRNESSSATLSVFVDGHYVAALAPGQATEHEASGSNHTVVWYFTGTHVPVCGPTAASVAPCEIAVLACGSEPAPCELSQLGLLVVRNGMDWLTFDAFVDDAMVARLAPQHQADAWVSAGAFHEVEFRGPLPSSDTVSFRTVTVAACEQLLVSYP